MPPARPPDAPSRARRPARATLRRAAYRLLGPRRYLRVVGDGFLLALRAGALRGRPAFEGHHFLPHLVRAGDTAIDIGANLGYYTVPLARLVGPTGRVVAVEPVELYRAELERRTRRLPQVAVLPFALGSEEGTTVRLGVPQGAEPHRHGLTRVSDDGRGTFEAIMRRPSLLFADLDRIDFVKCDVEGYELEVLPEMIGLIGLHRPVLQVETDGPRRGRLVELLGGLGYRAFSLRDGLLHALGAAPDAPGDVIFVPPARLTELSSVMAETAA